MADNTSSKKMVTGVFRSRLDAEKAFDYLYANGYRDNEISVLMSDSTRSTYYADQQSNVGKHTTGSLATEGMGVGGAIGTAVGATLAAVAAIGTSIAVPGLGLIVAGPIAAALAGGGAGAVTGGILGGAIGAAIPEQNADAYTEALRNGGVVIGVHPHSDDDVSRVRSKFEELGGENVFTA